MFVTTVPNAAAGIGWPVSTTSGPLHLNLSDHGDLVRKALFASCPLGATNSNVGWASLGDMCDKPK